MGEKERGLQGHLIGRYKTFTSRDPDLVSNFALAHYYFLNSVNVQDPTFQQGDNQLQLLRFHVGLDFPSVVNGENGEYSGQSAWSYAVFLNCWMTRNFVLTGKKIKSEY